MQGGYPPAGVWGSAPSPVPQHKKRALRVPEGHKKRASLNPSPNISANGAAILHPEGPRRFYSKNIIIGKTRVSRVPSVARNARRALPPEAPPSSRFFLHQAAFLASLRSLATLTAFAAAEVFGALPQTPARA